MFIEDVQFIQVEQEWNRGNHEGAKAASRGAKIWFIVSLVTGIIVYVTVVILFIIVIVAAGTTTVRFRTSSSTSNDYEQ